MFRNEGARAIATLDSTTLSGRSMKFIALVEERQLNHRPVRTGIP